MTPTLDYPFDTLPPPARPEVAPACTGSGCPALRPQPHQPVADRDGEGVAIVDTGYGSKHPAMPGTPSSTASAGR
jgi:hypothetical protein